LTQTDRQTDRCRQTGQVLLVTACDAKEGTLSSPSVHGSTTMDEINKKKKKTQENDEQETHDNNDVQLQMSSRCHVHISTALEHMAPLCGLPSQNHYRYDVTLSLSGRM